ncbi:hypothetical protein JG688_00003158 [Phytophthora aleatoria]|uniref:Uncharacterized protein n=1 Tax=Phytophthora aleatoria TaxID=2496075 RepID=A0A8J5ITS0_9STRA|nr:hypothetical protein JG688_00003158 [Phytophthora aleatoria]
MEDEDFVADSDEDEQEMLEALAMEEERLTRQRLEAGNHQQVERQEESREQNVTAVVTPEQPQAVQKQGGVQVEAVGEAGQDGEVETDEEQEQDGEGKTDAEQGEEEETEGVLEVGTLVEVESRTWPGINKQGGAGRITRVHRDTSKDGETEEIFYDVRYLTSEIYQTFKKGYYSDDEASNDSSLDIDVKAVRREAFYLSETLSFVLQEDVTFLLETMVPMCQFVRAVLNHANLNMTNPSADELGAANGVDSLTHFDFQLSELHSCLEWIVECLIKLVPGEEAVNSAICCVLLTELCGIVCEAIKFNDNRPMLEMIDLIELVLSYLQTVYVALSKRTTATIGTLFTARDELPLSVKLSAYRFSASAFRDIVVDERFKQISGQQMDSYGIRLARAATDLLTAIGRVAQHCKASCDERLQGFTTISSP